MNYSERIFPRLDEDLQTVLVNCTNANSKQNNNNFSWFYFVEMYAPKNENDISRKTAFGI